MDALGRSQALVRISLSVLCFVLYFVGIRPDFPVITYQVSTAGNSEIFQIYNTSQLTRSEAEAVCERCKNGGLAILSDRDMDTFVSMMLSNSAITSGKFWLGLKKSLTTWKWEDGNSVSFEKWATDHPLSGTGYAAVDIADGLWYSQTKTGGQAEISYVICQYANSDVGVYETDWSSWEKCDVMSGQQIRTKLCKSPASNAGDGCTCETYQKDTQDCAAESRAIQTSGSIIYQLYETNVNWYQAEHICGSCESGSIVMQHTEAEKQFIVDNIFAGMGWLDQYFVGLTTELVPSTWLWLDYGSVTWDNWALFNPSSDPTKSVACAVLLSGHTWYSCQKEDFSSALVCQYQETGKGLFGEWQAWGPCFALPWIGSGRRYRKRHCISPDAGGCSCGDVEQELRACTTAVKAIYERNADSFVFFEAAGSGLFSELVCSNWCPNLPGTLVQYQTQEKYVDIYNNLIRPNEQVFTNHFIGLADEKSEGVWRWLDGSQLPLNWSWWKAAEPSGGVLKNHAIMYAYVIPEVRAAMNLGSSASSDTADIVICEYIGAGGNGTWNPWSSWSACDALNSQSRIRTCKTPKPTMTGCECVGETVEQRSCAATSSSSTTQTTTSTSVLTVSTTAATTSATLPANSLPASTAASSGMSSTSLATTEDPADSTTLTSVSTSRSTIIATSSQSPFMLTQTTIDSSPMTTSTSASGSSTAALSTIQQEVSTVAISTSSVSSSNVSNKCYCPRLCETGYSQLTLEEKIAKLIKDLTVDKEILSATIRKRTSAADKRESAKGIGLFGCVILLLVLLTVFLMDFGRLASHSKSFINRLRYKG